MKQAVSVAVLVIILGIASGFPVFTCDKLKDVKEGADNHDQYLVALKDTDNYMDAEYLINLVKQYQTTLELFASNVQEPSIKSQLALSENAGVLQGTLSQQALLLVCLENSVEFIAPNYPELIVLPEGSGESHSTTCSKLILDEPYNRNDYSITFKPNTSTNDLYHIITKMEMTKLSDKSITFKYYYSIRKGKQLSMVVKINSKALEMVCKESQVKEIKPNRDVSVINKRDATTTTEQDLTTSDPCDLPEHNEEFPRIIFQYKKETDLDAIKETVEQYTKNSAQVESAIVLQFLDIIIFKMNRAAYLQACTNSEITSVEYELIITPVGYCGLPESDEEFPKLIFVYNRGADLDTIKKTVEEYTENSAKVKSAVTLQFLDMIIFQMNRAAYFQACTNSEIKSVEYDQKTVIAQQQKNTDTNICKQVNSLKDSYNVYSIKIRKPDTVEGRQSRCTKLITRLQNQAKKNDTFLIFTSSKSCKTNGTKVTLAVRLNVEALKYTCELKGLQVSVIRPSQEVIIG